MAQSVGTDAEVFGGVLRETTSPKTLREIQEKVTRWHEDRFPKAKAVPVAAKIAEEAGELVSAVLGTFAPESCTGSGDAGQEAADVVIVLLGLLGRFYPEVDLESEIDAKMVILNDPESSHRASLPKGRKKDAPPVKVVANPKWLDTIK